MKSFTKTLQKLQHEVSKKSKGKKRTIYDISSDDSVSEAEHGNVNTDELKSGEYSEPEDQNEDA